MIASDTQGLRFVGNDWNLNAESSKNYFIAS